MIILNKKILTFIVTMYVESYSKKKYVRDAQNKINLYELI